MFIAIEGLKGCGKSAVIAELLKNNKDRQFIHVHEDKKKGDDVPTIIDKRVAFIKNDVMPNLKSGKMVLCENFLVHNRIYDVNCFSIHNEEYKRIKHFSLPKGFKVLHIILDVHKDLCHKRINKNHLLSQITNEKKKEIEAEKEERTLASVTLDSFMNYNTTNYHVTPAEVFKIIIADRMSPEEITKVVLEFIESEKSFFSPVYKFWSVFKSVIYFILILLIFFGLSYYFSNKL